MSRIGPGEQLPRPRSTTSSVALEELIEGERTYLCSLALEHRLGVVGARNKLSLTSARRAGQAEALRSFFELTKMGRAMRVMC